MYNITMKKREELIIRPQDHGKVLEANRELLHTSDSKSDH